MPCPHGHWLAARQLAAQQRAIATIEDPDTAAAWLETYELDETADIESLLS